MTRQQKYPETGTFHYHNQNPKNRLTGDCIIRAISRAMELERLRGIKKKIQKIWNLLLTI